MEKKEGIGIKWRKRRGDYSRDACSEGKSYSSGGEFAFPKLHQILHFLWGWMLWINGITSIEMWGKNIHGEHDLQSDL